MELDLTKMISLVEKNMIDLKYGAIPPGTDPSSPIQTQQDVWKQGAPQQDDTMTASIRSLRTLIATCIYDALTDSASTGLGITVPPTFGGGDKTPGAGNFNIVIPTGKTGTIQAGTSVLQVTPAGITLTSNGLIVLKVDPTGILISVDAGVTWKNLMTHVLTHTHSYQDATNIGATMENRTTGTPS